METLRTLLRAHRTGLRPEVRPHALVVPSSPLERLLRWVDAGSGSRDRRRATPRRRAASARRSHSSEPMLASCARQRTRLRHVGLHRSADRCPAPASSSPARRGVCALVSISSFECTQTAHATTRAERHFACSCLRRRAEVSVGSGMRDYETRLDPRRLATEGASSRGRRTRRPSTAKSTVSCRSSWASTDPTARERPSSRHGEPRSSLRRL